MSTSNPSTYKQAQKAQGDEIKDLKQKYSRLAAHVDNLQESLDNATSDANKLQDDANEAISAYEGARDRLEKVEAELRSVKKFQTRATKLLVALTSGHNVDKIRSDIFAAALESRDPQEHLRALVDGQSGSEQEDGDENQPDGEGTADSGGASGSLQEELRDSAKMLKVVQTALCRLFGATTHLRPEHMRFPEGLLPEDPEWPSNGEGEERQAYLRFDFTKKHDDPINIEGFNRWCRYVRTRGAELEPEAQPVLDQASDTTIQARCIIKFNYQAAQFRKYLKEQNNTLDEENAGDAPKAQSLAHLRSRADGKIKVRERKLATIPATEYTEMERRTFLTHGAQSADEEEWIAGPDGQRIKTPNVFVTRPWSFLSERFKAMKSRVDSCVDPQPPRGYATRKPGPPRDGPPPKNKCNQFLLREWMVDSDILTNNPEWKRSRRVIPDNEPIESAPPSRKRKQAAQSGTNSAGPSTAASEVKRARRTLHEAEAAHNTDLGGQTLTQLRDELNNFADESAGEEEGDKDFDAEGEGDDA